jgi:Spy/CpxP family protein refolding chaperone
MKLKLMPVLTGAVLIALAATPLAVKAAPITPGQQLLAQAARQQRQGKFANLNLTQEQKDQMRQLRQETQREIESVLTQRQLEQYKATMQSRRGRMRSSNGNLANSGQGQQSGRRNVFDDLNLSSSQKDRIQQIRQQSRDRMRSILTREQQDRLQQGGRSMRNQDQYMRNQDQYMRNQDQYMRNQDQYMRDQDY